MRLMVLAAALMMVGVALAGCASQSESPEAAESAAAEPVVTTTSGGISGLVHDEELAPLSKVQVGLVETGTITHSDSQGRFSFDGLDPGIYRLVANRLGLESTASKVEVSADRVTELTLVMKRIEIQPDPYVDVLVFEGTMQCAVNENNARDPCDGVTGESVIAFQFDVNPEADLGELVAEMQWTPASSVSGQELEMDLCDWGEGRTNDDGLCSGYEHVWHFPHGASPIVIRQDGEDLPLKQTLTYQVGGSPVWVADASAGNPGVVAYQQRFTIYVSLCYYAECSDDYTAIPAT